MLSGILTAEQRELLGTERELLADVEAVLSRDDAHRDHRDHGTAVDTLRASVRQLDELFLLVVVGEFNSGKSAFINALLNQTVLAEGVTPTTSRIHLLCHGDEVCHDTGEAEVEMVAAPAELLREVSIVDTPGTNALDRRHEAITSDYVPRADLVLFVTSADRPFSESERAFLERIRAWGKNVVVILNKIDILSQPEAVNEITTYISDNSERLLGLVPPIFPLSSLNAQQAGASDDPQLREQSGLPAIEEFLQTTLDQAERVRLKLRNPLGVADTLLAAVEEAIESLLELLREDVATLQDIEQQLKAYADDVEREFQYRLADIDNDLHRLEKRGLEFFDDKVRLGRLPDLLKRDRLRAAFEEAVVADTPQQIETKVESIIDWLVSSDLDQWQAVVQHVNRRRAIHEDRIVGEVGGRFSYDRARLLDTVGQAARDGLSSYDRAAESRRMAEDVQRAVAGTALVEVGAVGLGATIAFLASGTAADATGLIAAGLLAALGLFILPHRRRRAKQDLKDKISTLRADLMNALSQQFRSEADGSQNRIREAIAPYTRFVRSERERLEGRREEIVALRTRIDELEARIDAATA
jgi:GTP-binding protein EngB required for normal cell division